MVVAELKRFSLVKPTLNTRFHIDFDWWRQNDRDWRIYLLSYLCPEHQELFSDLRGEEMVDWVDPDTAEVQQVDGLQHILITHCAQEEGFISTNMTLVDGVFRLLLSNGNVPMTPMELAENLGRPPGVILQTLSGGRVYKGLRPCPGC
jgi:hypothetical protein